MGGLPQPITGPLINAMLIITTTLVGHVSGLILGVMTPLFAVLRGELPPILAPMIPFIMISNMLLVTIYYLLKLTSTRKNPMRRIKVWLGLMLAAIAKFLFLTLAVKIMLPYIFGHQIPAPLAFMMTIPQLLTAVAGGVIAVAIYEILFQAGITE